MDTIPDGEFLALFHRINKYVRLGRVRNPDDIRKRIRRILELQRKAYRTAKRSSTIRKYRRDFVHLRVLYRKHIERRIWNEAVENPGGLYDLTLDYGYANARRILIERATRRRMKLLRMRRLR